MPNPKPRIQPCVPGDTAAAAGTLLIEPSQVPGISVDSAGWRTIAQTVDVGAEITLVLATRLRTTGRIAMDSILLIYTFRAPQRDSTAPVLADSAFGPPIYTARILSDVYVPRIHAVLPPDTVIGTEMQHTLELAYVTSSSLRTACPASVRVIPREAFHPPPQRGRQLFPIR